MRNIMEYRLAPVHIKPKDADLYPTERKSKGTIPGRRRKKIRKPVATELDYPTSGAGWALISE